MRELVESRRVFFGDEIRTHAVPDDEDDVAPSRSCVSRRYGERRNGNEEEFSRAHSLVGREFRSKKAACHPSLRAGLTVFFVARDDKGAAGITDTSYKKYSRGLVTCQRRAHWNKVRSRESWILQQRQSIARDRTEIFVEAIATKSAALPQSNHRAGLSCGEK